MKRFTKLFLSLALLLVGVGGANATETVVHECDYTGKTSYPWYRMGTPEGSSYDVENGLLVIKNTVEQEYNYSLQPFVDDNIPTIFGYNYIVRFTLKCTAAGSLTCNMGTWSAGKSANFDVTATENFITKEVSLYDFPVSATNVHVLLQGGKFIGTIYLKKVEVIQIEPVAPTKTTTVSEEVSTTTGSTFTVLPYTKFSVTKVPDLAFSINNFSMGDYDDFIIDIAEPTTVGDWLICNVAEPYAHNGWWETIAPGTSGQVKLGDDHKNTTSLVLQAGNPDSPRDICINDVYFYKKEGNIKYSILSTLGGVKEYADKVGAKAFDITNVNVANYNKLILTFSSPTVGTWTVTYDGTSEDIPEGSMTYTIDVRDLSTISTLILSVGAGDFPRVNNFEKLTLEKSSTKRMDALANDEIFSFADATGYNAETKTFSNNGGWTFDSPVDISAYKYLYITTAQSFDAAHSITVTITDDNGKSIGGGDYKWENSGIRGGCMYLDNWNHKNVLCINLQYLEEGLDVDITKIKSLKFGGDVIVNNVVLSNYASNEFIGTEQYHTYSTGNYQRPYEAADLGKFGTICLPYKAISAGAFIYQIASASAAGISLERVDGILEAGKPYFYQATDDRFVTGNPAVNIPNVNFFCVDWTGSVASPVVNNGLVGTFAEINAPKNDNTMVLSGNKLYTVDSDVKVGANKAYIDLTMVNNNARGTVFISFDEITGIKTVSETQNAGKIYDLSGREVTKPAKGIYVIDGKKVIIK